jgi:DnaJ-class molecular chaperone
LIVSVPPESECGTVLRLHNKGMPRRTGGYGDLLVRLNVHNPKGLRTREVNLFRQLASMRTTA